MDKKIQNKIENEYFEYKGQRYCAGTKFTMQKRNGYDRWRVVEANFIGYVNGNPNLFYVHYKDMNVKSLRGADIYVHIKREEMKDAIIDIIYGNYHIEIESRKRYCKDSDIPELVIGWPLYIFFMALATIFYKTIGAWIMLTIMFFTWRHHLKTKEYYYYE